MAGSRAAALASAAFVLAACAASGAERRALAELRAFENSRRAAVDFAREWAEDGSFGSDPYRLVALPGARDSSQRVLGILRGSSQLLLLDAGLRELARAPAPRRPLALALGSTGEAFVAGELEARIRRYSWEGGLLERGAIEVPGVFGLSALAAGPNDSLYAASAESEALLRIEGASSSSARVQASLRLGHGVRALAYVPGYVVANSLLEHTLVVVPVGASGAPRGEPVRIVHDGPFWGFALAARPEGLLIAAVGVENHPLDRRIGSFGYIDSFLYLYEVEADGAVRLRAELNTSEHGVVTPKAVTLAVRGSAIEVDVPAYGSAAGLRLEYADGFALRRLTPWALPPGTAASAVAADGGWLAANPLLDAWLRRTPAGALSVVPALEPRDARTPSEKLGEALQYTTLMAPENSADGALSRFTCEACHFEGYVDGRTHHTGRGTVRATTKPLLGLFNNRPYFSRALDPDLSAMVNNEFHVAGANSGHPAWFGVSLADAPWLAALGVSSTELSPEELRRALMTHLMRASHAPNPESTARSELDTAELAGARVFLTRCEGCHQARLDTSRAESRVPFEDWPRFIFSAAEPLVWASDEYAQTGVLPYVHARGARVPSLRRLHKKYPYFTNGSGKSLEQVLAHARFSSGGFVHAGGVEAPGSAVGNDTEESSLSAAEQAALLRFLGLL